LSIDPSDPLSQCASPAPINITNFATAPDKNLSGLAYFAYTGPSQAVLRLTDNDTRTIGGYWACQPVTGGFDTTFTYQIIGQTPTSDLADGFAFVIGRNPDWTEETSGYKHVGAGGCEIGYGRIKNSLAVEFDTFYNNEGEPCDWMGDADDHHISVQSKGPLPNSPSHIIIPGSPNPDYNALIARTSFNPALLRDRGVHQARIVYDPSQAESLKIYLDGVQKLQTSVNLATLLNLPNGKAWVGFTAAVGAVTAQYDILAWQFQGNAPPATVTPTPVVCPWGGTFIARNNPTHSSPMLATGTGTPTGTPTDADKEDHCEYTFNASQRDTAVNYALSWANRACPLFCAFQFSNYVDQSRLPTPVPPTSTYICAPNATDCANFLSQAYFLAGFPMTKSFFCEFLPSGASSILCVRGQGSASGSYNFYSGWASAIQDTGMPMYFGRWYTPLGGSRYKVLGLHGYNTRYATEVATPPQNPTLATPIPLLIEKGLVVYCARTQKGPAYFRIPTLKAVHHLCQVQWMVTFKLRLHFWQKWVLRKAIWFSRSIRILQ
jgi:hypothetical protein